MKGGEPHVDQEVSDVPAPSQNYLEGNVQDHLPEDVINQDFVAGVTSI